MTLIPRRPLSPQDSKGEKRADGRQKRIVWKCDCAGMKTPRKGQKDLTHDQTSRERPSKRQGCPFQVFVRESAILCVRIIFFHPQFDDFVVVAG